MLLFETGLITRYYLPPEDLRPSPTCTLCSYKGRSRHENAAWQDARPQPSVAAIAGHLAFWNEREDTAILIDGESLEWLGVRDGGEMLPPWHAILVDQALRHVGSAGAVEHAAEILVPLAAPVTQHVVLVERVGRLQPTGRLALDDDVVPSIDLRQAWRPVAVCRR